MSIDLKKIEQKKKSSGGINWQKNFNVEIRFRKKVLSAKKKESLYSELGILIGSGLDIKNSMLVMMAENKKGTRELYQAIYEQLIKGVSLSQSLLDSGKVSKYEYYTIKIGEETGNLCVVLKQLTLHFSAQIKQRRQLISTFSYPALVILTAIMVVLFMMNFIIPMFEELFNRFNGELPSLTKAIIGISDFISSYMGLIFSAVFTLVLLIYSFRKRTFFRRITSKLVLKIPGIRTIVKKIYLAKYCQTFSLLNSSKIPIVTSIQLIQKIIGFYPFENALLKIEMDLTNGKLLYETYQQFEIFEPKLISLTKVGEEVNKLNEIYENLSKQYSEEVQYKVSVLNTVLEPLLILFIGVFVAVILIAMYLPMFQMSNQMF